MIRIIFGFFIFFIVITFVIWLSMAKNQENYIKDLISENLNEKYKITYSLNTTGYPNRLDTSIKNIKLTSEDSFEIIDIKNFLFMSLIYDKKKHIISIKPPVNIKVGTNLFLISEGIMNASMEKSNDDDFYKFTLHGIKISLKLNDKQFLEVEDLILATRSKHSKDIENNKEFYLKIQKPIFNIDTSNDNTKFNFKFSLDQFKGIKLPQLLNQSFFFKKYFKNKNGRIEINDTNINLENYLSKIPTYFDELLLNKNILSKNIEL